MSSTWFKSAFRKSIMPGCSGSSKAGLVPRGGAAAALVSETDDGSLDPPGLAGEARLSRRVAGSGRCAFGKTGEGADEFVPGAATAGLMAVAGAAAFVPPARAWSLLCWRICWRFVSMAARAAASGGAGKAGI
jgi:hypothetical protein